MNAQFYLTVGIAAVIVALLVAAIFTALAHEARRVVGKRAGRRVTRTTEARRTLSRAADLKFPTHRGVPRG